ncbi:winged helix-turn-helix transcriptional regulator [Candidatus Uhrbacteria bacterium]|nr:winged helix-turn-helix transcriptional regulator [Candidatus Uhrbacteria bacterium]
MRQLERTLKALANRRRLAIVEFLREKEEAPVWEIANKIKLSLKATSKHLGILFAADIVDRDQRSLEMFYRLSKDQPSGAKQIISLL